MHSARYDIVSGALRCRLDQHRGLDFGESHLVEVVSADLSDPVSEGQVSLHLVLTQIKISVFESQIVVDIVVILDIDRRSFRL